MNKLETIMQKQRELQERLGFNFSHMTPQQCAEYMRDNRGYLEDEVAEALYEMPFYKSWKDYSNMTEEETMEAWQKVRMELVDSLHFFVNLLLCAGFSADELFDMYMAKNKENHRRQDTGYTADVSYREQSVEDVMNNAEHATKEAVSNVEPTCTVVMPGEISASEDFVAMLKKSDGKVTAYYNTDLMTLGLAARELQKSFDEALEQCSEEDRNMLLEVMNHE